LHIVPVLANLYIAINIKYFVLPLFSVCGKKCDCLVWMRTLILYNMSGSCTFCNELIPCNLVVFHKCMKAAPIIHGVNYIYFHLPEKIRTMAKTRFCERSFRKQIHYVFVIFKVFYELIFNMLWSDLYIHYFVNVRMHS